MRGAHKLQWSGDHRDYKRIEWASREKSRDKLNKSNGVFLSPGHNTRFGTFVCLSFYFCCFH